MTDPAGGFDNPLDILGVPKWVVVEALSRDDMAVVARLAERKYHDLARVAHSDIPGSLGDHMAMLNGAIEEVRNPAGLRVLAQWYVDPDAVSQAQKAAAARRMTARTVALQERLARALVNVDGRRVLGSEGPVRFIAALADQPYAQAVVGEMTGRDSTIQISEPVSAGFGSAFFDGRPRFSQQEGVWRDKAAVAYHDEEDINPKVMEMAIGRLRMVPSGVRLVGGVARAYFDYLQESQPAPDDEILDAAALLEAVSSDRRLEWAGLHEAWWMPMLQPYASVGDALVFALASDESLAFAIAGPLLAVQPM